jgi:hypothetical protein
MEEGATRWDDLKDESGSRPRMSGTLVGSWRSKSRSGLGGPQLAATELDDPDDGPADADEQH